MIEFHAIPAGRVLAVTHAVRIGDGPTIFVGRGGRLYSSGIRRGRVVSSDTYLPETTIKALVKLGAVTEAAAQAHHAAVAARTKAERAYWSLHSLRKNAAETGVSLVHDAKYDELVALAKQYKEVE